MDIQLNLLIKHQRKAKGLSIRDLEAISGVSRNYISEIERGLSMPSILVLCKIAKALQIPVTDLFWYK